MRPFDHGRPHRDQLRRLTKISKIQEGCLMTEPLAPEDFPGPPGLPFLGNVRAIDLAQPIESDMNAWLTFSAIASGSWWTAKKFVAPFSSDEPRAVTISRTN